MTSLCVASDGLLGSGRSLTIASRGLLCLAVTERRRVATGSGRKRAADKKLFPERIKDGIVNKNFYDDEEDIVLLMMNIF